MKELVRKAVLATLSRQDFEKELEKLEGKQRKKPAAKAAPSKAARPEPKDVKAKMRQLRAALESGDGDKGLTKIFEAFEKKANTASSPEEQSAAWDELGVSVTDAMKGALGDAKAKIASGKSGGEDVSKLNLLVAKTDIGLVSLETSISLRNMAKAKEIVQKLSDLKSQIQKEL